MGRLPDHPVSPDAPAPSRLNADAALRDLFGYAEFRPGQASVVDAVLAGEDVLAIMPTGAGKSLCYQLPAFLLPGCTVVISPLVALMKDQLDSLPPPLRERAAVFNSTLERGTLDAQTVDLIAGRLRLIYVAPERLRQRPFLHALQRASISRLVIDEAHCISLWGHDFRPDYLFIPDVLEMLGRPPILAMTATAPPRVQEELQQRLRRPLHIINTGVLRPNLLLEVQQVTNKEEKLRRLVDICTNERGSGIIYVGSRENAETVARLLRRERINARHYHAGLDPAERSQVQDDFKRGRVRVITATIAFGMGVDKPDVRFIVHFNPSRSLEAYAQESGRAGRDGRPARCVLFWASSDKAALSRWMREDALTPEVLRAVYRAVRRDVRSGYAWWPLDRLVSATRDELPAKPDTVDETTVRVALGALEQVGVLRRHCDLPEAAQIRLAGTADPTVAALSHALDAAPGNRIARNIFQVAGALDCNPPEVEERLLTLEDEGTLSYFGTGRGLLIELLPHPDDLATRLRRQIDGYELAQRERVEEIDRYATRRVCRTAAIARHFGVPHPGHCDHCDVCLGVSTPAESSTRHAESSKPRDQAPPPDRAPEDIIVECIAELPFQMGRTGVAKVLKGSIGAAVQEDRSRHFGALAALPASHIEREIDRLVEDGYLHRDDSEYRRLTVAEKGFTKPPAPWPPPRPAGRGAGVPPRPDRPGTALAQLQTWNDDDPIVEERLAALKEWRREQLQGTSLPAYTVFNDETLHLLAATRITSLNDLSRLKGIGPAKLERYGTMLLELIGEVESI